MPELPPNAAIHRTSSSSGLLPESSTGSSTTIRPRNRRPPTSNPTSLLPTPSESPSRGASPLPSARIGSVTGRNNARTGSPAAFGSGGNTLLGGGVSSWATPSWSSIQGLASSFLGGAIGVGDGASDQSRGQSRSSSRKGLVSRRSNSGFGNGSAASGTWGPEPPNSKPRLNDVAGGSLADREAKLKAMKTASVLQSHEGVNGGLDVSGRYKKRRSDEDLRGSAAVQSEGTEEHLVYIHHVQPSDTYAGIVLKYKCREDAFRKANGLWSRDNTYVQVRKWLALPVDACEIRGRPCEAPSYYNSNHVDLLAPTPEATSQDDPFSAGKAPQHQPPHTFDEDRPWTHVRWVTIDNFTAPVEIARVPRKVLGYFPPRRKKSLVTVSNLSTPRGSMDVPSVALGSEALDHTTSPGSTRSRRLSILSGTGARSVGDLDNPHRPAWMRRPGGVGSLHSKVRGPEKDYFNSWTKKHLPGLNIDNMPSMSVMGSETARIGFDDPVSGDTTGAAAGIVESPFEDGRELESVNRARGASGNGLDKAAAAVETWLRGAFAKIPPGTPVLGPRGRSHAGSHSGQNLRQMEGDLIELTDTNSDDGRGLDNLLDSGLLSSGLLGSSGRSEGGSSVKTLWREGAGDKSGGHNIRLTVCKNCGRFCDKYVEHDFVVLFIDLVLIKPQVYRHLLHNTLMRERDEFAPSIVRLGVLLLLFDVYLTWARIEKQAAPPPEAVGEGMMEGGFGRLSRMGIGWQYLFFLLLCTTTTLTFHLSIRFLSCSPYSPLVALGLLPRYNRPNSVSTALLVSSSTKLFPILMVIWEYDVPAAARSLGWAVVANNVEALRILLDCGYGVAALLATVGAASRWAAGRAVMWGVGLQGVDGVGEGGVAEDGRALWDAVKYCWEWAGRLVVG
ncbi:Arv1-like family-domain-containing protein [Coniochaeta sp. 2T2.1]|nr:Arv1-like family-domain-containing protein [Coniochaeta sp. 2T2.1]